MIENQKIRPESVIGPLGEPLTLEDLPKPNTRRWVVRRKAEVVAADEREAGRRAVLNYGHTLGHAIETKGGYDMRHGEAVAVGLVFAAELAAMESARLATAETGTVIAIG